jgi:hypothetical protein
LGMLIFEQERGMRGTAEVPCVMSSRLLILVLVNFFFLGCQSLDVNVKPVGRFVPEGKWILLSQTPDQSGSWQTRDLVLDYKYDRDQSQFYISGAIRFIGPIRNEFEIVDYFHLDAIPVDAQGTVLDMMALTTAGEVNTVYDGPVTFDKILALPTNTAGMAFGYTGRASGSGSYFEGGTGDFWEYPYY